MRIALSLADKCNLRVEAVTTKSWGNNLRIVHAEQLTISAARHLEESGQDEEHAAQ
jgi:N-formylglutamate amidohydrolase